MADQPSPTPQQRSRRGRRIVLVIAALVLAAAVAAAIWLASAVTDDDGDDAAAPPTPVSTTSSPATAAPDATSAPTPTATIDPDFGEPVADQAPKNKPAQFGDNVTAELVDITPITAEGTQAGEVSGPAVQVDLQIVNGSDTTLSLDAVTVNAYYGSDLTPAPRYFEPADAGFSGTLAAGGSAQGRYVFSVPQDESGDVLVTVGRGGGSPIVVLG